MKKFEFHLKPTRFDAFNLAPYDLWAQFLWLEEKVCANSTAQQKEKAIGMFCGNSAFTSNRRGGCCFFGFPRKTFLFRTSGNWLKWTFARIFFISSYSYRLPTNCLPTNIPSVGGSLSTFNRSKKWAAHPRKSSYICKTPKDYIFHEDKQYF